MRSLRFGNRVAEPDVRTVGDMTDLLYDKKGVRFPAETELYYMYRGLSLTGLDRESMAKHSLRYDITIIPPRVLGREYVKTAGHYHPLVPGTSVTYPELYEVLEGKAHYLLQKEDNGGVSDAVVVEAGKGDKVVMMPGYGHITINPSNKELKMANIVSDKFSSVYDPIKRKHGGAYYELVDGFRKNPDYASLPELRIVKAKKITELGLKKSEEIYSLITKDIRRLDFLNRPQDDCWLSHVY